jgi:hypothetical protein
MREESWKSNVVKELQELMEETDGDDEPFEEQQHFSLILIPLLDQKPDEP